MDGLNDGGGYGNYVIIQEPKTGRCFLYAHLKAGTIKVKKGDNVKVGTKIAIMGSSGDSGHMHLHFEIRTSKNAIITEYSDGKHTLVVATDSSTLDPEKYVGSKPIVSKPIVSAKVKSIETTRSQGKEKIYINFDKEIIVKQVPILNLEIGNTKITATYKGLEKNNKRMIYEIDYNNLDVFLEGTVTIKSLSEGNIVNKDNSNCKANTKISEKKLQNIESLSTNLVFKGILKYNRGDVNGDGKIDIRDASLLAQTFTNKDIRLTKEQLNKADVNMDGKVQITDISMLVRYVNATSLKSNDQLLNILNCDFNNDGKVNKYDYNMLEKATKNKYANKYDLNNDGMVNIRDLAKFKSILKSNASR